MPRRIVIDNNVVYQPDISTDIQCLLCLKSPCHPLSCLCFPTVSSKAAESTYIHVYENRIEYNYPLTTITWDCSCQVVDKVTTIFYDRNQMNEVYSLEGCICDYDKTVILRRESCTTCSDVETDQCCGRVFLPCVENAPALVEEIRKQKDKRLPSVAIVTDMDRK
jgi:hypothetical protein